MTVYAGTSAPVNRMSDTETIVPTDGRGVIRVDHFVDYGAGAPVDAPLPLVRVEVDDPGEGYRAAYLTAPQARALAAALNVSAYRAGVEARGDL